MLSCLNESVMPFDGLIWFYANNREQLLMYDDFHEAMSDMFFSKSEYMRVGYDTIYAPKWVSFDNKIDSGTFYDYYELTTDGMELINEGVGKRAITSPWVISNNYSSVFRLHPNGHGTKFIYVTDESIDIIDQIGLAGGIYSSINEILNYVAFVAIWGISFGVIKLKGVAPDAGPNKIMQAQLDPYLKKRDKAILHLSQTIEKLQAKIEQLEKDKMSNNNNNNNNNGGNNNISKMLGNYRGGISGEYKSVLDNETDQEEISMLETK